MVPFTPRKMAFMPSHKKRACSRRFTGEQALPNRKGLRQDTFAGKPASMVVSWGCLRVRRRCR